MPCYFGSNLCRFHPCLHLLHLFIGESDEGMNGASDLADRGRLVDHKLSDEGEVYQQQTLLLIDADEDNARDENLALSPLVLSG